MKNIPFAQQAQSKPIREQLKEAKEQLQMIETRLVDNPPAGDEWWNFINKRNELLHRVGYLKLKLNPPSRCLTNSIVPHFEY